MGMQDMAIQLVETTEQDLNTKAVKNSDNLPIDAEFFSLNFIKQNICEAANITLKVSDEAREILEKDIEGICFDVDQPVYRCVKMYPNGVGVQVMIGGFCTFSSLPKHLFEVMAVRTTKNGKIEYWNDSPYLGGVQVAEMRTAEQVNDILNLAKVYDAQAEATSK